MRRKTLEELQEIIGAEAAARLVRDFGGRTDVTVHAKPKPNSHLARSLGPDAYAALCARCAGEVLTIPLAGNGRLARLIETVRQERKRDTVATIARRHGLHMRTVWRYLRQTRNNP